MTGKLWGVSIGPGDAELLTIKAIRIINECKTIASARTKGEKSVALDIVSEAVNIEDKETLYLDFLMTKDEIELLRSHKKIAEKIANVLKKGKDIAFVVLGDISIYSTFSYIQREISDMGFETEICPGVPSFCAVGARLNTSLTKMKKPLHIIPANHVEVADCVNLKGTKVFMKAGGKTEDIKKYFGVSKAHGIENCGMDTERIIRDFDDKYGYFTTVIIEDKD